MKLHCKYCHSEIPSEHVNVQEGFLHCVACDEFFRVIEAMETTEAIALPSRPVFSKIEIASSPTELKIDFPPGSWSAYSLFFIAATPISCILTASLYSVVKVPFPLKLFFLVLSGSLLLLTAFLFFGKTQFRMDEHRIFLTRTLFGLKLQKARSTKRIIDITKGFNPIKKTIYTTGLRICFRGEEPLHFAMDLSEEEEIWLLDRIEFARTKFFHAAKAKKKKTIL